MPVQAQLTDEQLHIKLINSYLDFQQVLIISPLIPTMNSEQRDELLKLIEESKKLNGRKQDADNAYNEGLAELNKEYTHKMDQMVVQESNYARKQYELLNTEKDEQEMANLEDQIKTI